MKVATRQAITRRTACCVGWVLLATVGAGCSVPVGHAGSTRAQPGSKSMSRSVDASHTVPHTLRDGQLLVTGRAPEARLRTVVRDARIAVSRVRQIWGSSVLSGPVHIEVPADEAGFRAAGGSVEPGAQVAATTTPAGLVVLAPDLFSQVSGQGVLVVLTHELTHVALHQTGDSAPARWVVEGAAEFTAYRPTGLTLPRLTPQLAAAVRAGHTPSGPPSDARFRSDPDAAYQDAYAWCAFLVHRFGMAAFTGFVRSSRPSQHADFTVFFGTSIGSLDQPFRAFLRAQITANSPSAAPSS